jgi:hypothetical protein
MEDMKARNSESNDDKYKMYDHATAQPVSRWLLTTGARDQSQDSPYRQSNAGVEVSSVT